MFKHILIPTDGSGCRRKQSGPESRWRALMGAKVTGFFAAPAPTPLVYGDFMPVGYMPPDQHAER